MMNPFPFSLGPGFSPGFGFQGPYAGPMPPFAGPPLRPLMPGWGPQPGLPPWPMQMPKPTFSPQPFAGGGGLGNMGRRQSTFGLGVMPKMGAY